MFRPFNQAPSLKREECLAAGAPIGETSPSRRPPTRITLIAHSHRLPWSRPPIPCGQVVIKPFSTPNGYKTRDGLHAQHADVLAPLRGAKSSYMMPHSRGGGNKNTVSIMYERSWLVA
jgi:hypothetical protein